MIKIDLKLFATLSKYLPENSGAIELSDRTTVEKLARDFDIPLDQVKLIFVNGRKQDITYELKDLDRVGLFPPVGGG